MVAGAVAEGQAVAVRQAGEHEHVVPERRQRLQHARQLEARAGALRRPVGHRDAVGDVDEGQALGGRLSGRRLAALAKRRCHGVEHRQGDGRAEAPKEGAARQVPVEPDDRSASLPVTLLSCRRVALRRRIWNGKLFTISSTRPENRYSCGGSRLAMPSRSGVVALECRGRARKSATSTSDAREKSSPILQQDRPQLRRPVERCGRRAARPTGRSANLPSIVRQAPMASKFSRPKPSGSMRRWHDAHVGLLRCASICCRSDAVSPIAVSSRSGTSAGGAGGGASSRLSSTHLPRSTGDVRVAYDDTVSTLACVRRRHAACRFRSTRRNFGPETSDAVMLASRSLRNISPSRNSRMLRSSRMMLEEQLRLVAHREAQVVVEARELLADPGRRLECAELQPLAAELLGQRRRPRIDAACAHLGLQHDPVASMPRSAGRRSSASGMHQRKYDRRDASLRARPPVPPRPRRDAILFDAEQEVPQQNSGAKMPNDEPFDERTSLPAALP